MIVSAEVCPARRDDRTRIYIRCVASRADASGKSTLARGQLSLVLIDKNERPVDVPDQICVRLGEPPRRHGRAA